MADASALPQPAPSNCADADLDIANLTDTKTDGDKQNSHSVYCPRCPSLILRPGNGIYVNIDCWPLPDMEAHVKKETGSNLNQGNGVPVYQHFWAVADIFTFENVGYTNTVSGKYRYLTCADCECGPIGVQVTGGDDLDSAKGLKKGFSYVALARVVHR